MSQQTHNRGVTTLAGVQKLLPDQDFQKEIRRLESHVHIYIYFHQVVTLSEQKHTENIFKPRDVQVIYI